jgi:hypothetical protein
MKNIWICDVQVNRAHKDKILHHCIFPILANLMLCERPLWLTLALIFAFCIIAGGTHATEGNGKLSHKRTTIDLKIKINMKAGNVYLQLHMNLVLWYQLWTPLWRILLAQRNVKNVQQRRSQQYQQRIVKAQ